MIVNVHCLNLFAVGGLAENFLAVENISYYFVKTIINLEIWLCFGIAAAERYLITTFFVLSVHLKCLLPIRDVIA